MAPVAETSELAVILERARIMMARQEFDAAEHEYERAVSLHPTHPAVHFGLAKLRHMRGDQRFARDLAAAAARHRDQPDLQTQFAEVLRLTGDLDGSALLLRDLVGRRGPLPELRSLLARVLHESGQLHEAEAEAAAAASSRPDDASLVEPLVAARLSLGRADETMPLIRAQRSRAPHAHVWIAFEATAARLLGDPAYRHLYDYDRLVRVYDVEPPSGWGSIEEFNRVLGAALRERHTLARAPFDQSMRSGTQTIGDLCRSPDPVIRTAFEMFLEPIEDYRAALGHVPDHPLSAANRGTTRYSGSWSVQLGKGGFHVNHIHTDGLLSSAYYVSVPTEVEDERRQSGWIKFGEPPFPVPGASAQIMLKPKPGRLVLFPSYMWHGTTAIHEAGRRLTVAFDVVTSS